jgi:hypothetical protein
MKYGLLPILFLSLALFVFAQDKPLSQTEYVKMLYGLQKSPGTKSDIVDALRRRGIDFVLTDGIRGLTRSKGGNDEELRRALEEADRRRQNPEGSKLPSSRESETVLSQARKNTLEAVDEMPDFVVKQQIQRSAAFAGTNNFRNLDQLVVAVSYRSSGEESYKVLTVNGAVQNNPESKSTYEEVGGTSSTGEFVTMLATIFKPESETKFEVVDTDTIRDRRTIVYDFTVDRDHAKQMLSCKATIMDSTQTGIKGRVWLDRDSFRVLRIESEATDIPAGFPCPTAKRNIDYEWTTIANEKYLLPLLSDVRLTIRDSGKIYETRNLIKFKNYQKYGTDIIILEEDSKPIEEEKKPNQ